MRPAPGRASTTARVGSRSLKGRPTVASDTTSEYRELLQRIDDEGLMLELLKTHDDLSELVEELVRLRDDYSFLVAEIGRRTPSAYEAANACFAELRGRNDV